MKRILLFLVAAVFLPTGTASAALMVKEYVTGSGEMVVLDTKTGSHWYWNLNDFVMMTYAQQISAIGGISPTYGWIAGGWHMASLTELQALATYAGSDIMAAFGSPTGAGWGVMSMGRYDDPWDSQRHRCMGRWTTTWFVSWPIPWPDTESRYDLGAWVTTDASVVPAPPAVVLATTGMMTGLLCMLGAKLRGRRALWNKFDIESR